MTPLSFITASLRHYRRIHFSVALGVVAATAVLTGALLVGDSVRGSLRDLTLQRLGRIDSALVAPHLFRDALAEELAASASVQKYFTAVEPALLMSGTLQAGSGTNATRANNVSVIASRPTFWSLGQGGPQRPLDDDEIAITDSLARELGVEVGAEILLRIPVAGAIPADSPLGEKTDTSRANRFKVAAVLPIDGLARFGLFPSQHPARNVFLPLSVLQALLEKPGKANAILVATDQTSHPAGETAQRALAAALHPRLEDYGVRIERVARPLEYLQISADQLVLPDEIVLAAQRVFGRDSLQPVSTYLANTLVAGKGDSQRKIPYSTIVGVDSSLALGPLLDESNRPIKLADHEIVLNRWAANDLQAQLGDQITVTFYEPESTHGRLREHEPPPVFTLAALVELQNADGQPNPAADPKLTPELPGVTDQASISDWDLPFELVEKIRPQDETYWDDYRTTPKAFVSLATAQRLWPSRWGTISLLRAPSGATAHVSEVNVADQLAKEITPDALGMAFQPVKQIGLRASTGTTPFGALFIGFSFFLIAAALMLIALLFQLGIQQRAAELGTLAAVGIPKHRVARLLSREGLVVAGVGAAFGIGIGILYAWSMVELLRTWWVAAIATPFLELHVTWPSLVLGGLLGLAASWLTIRWSIARLLRQPVARLITGAVTDEPRSPDLAKKRRALWPLFRIALVFSIIALVFAGFRLQGESQAGIFFASGAATLALLLGEIRSCLHKSRRSASGAPRFSLAALSALNTTRNPDRSTLTIGLVAAASFLIIALSAFRLETGDSGTGGFELLATSDLPIHYDLNSAKGRLELGISDGVSQELSDYRVYSLRVSGGEDASCLNLYRSTQPRVLGVPTDWIKRGQFVWSEVADHDDDNPWTLLLGELGNDQNGQRIVPVVIDASTAIYGLHLKGVGSQLTIRDAADQPVTLQVVGLLKNSVLQGSLLISEANFLRLFPDTGGYRFFMIAPRKSKVPAEPRRNAPDSLATASLSRPLQQSIESALADFGFDAVDARQQLAAYMAVQNTYLSTFQSLGALGLLLGTIGLAAVQLRSVIERRRELALMRAAGFCRSRLIRMVIGENAVLLLGGLAVGCAAAAVALIPQWVPRQAAVPWFSLVSLLATIAVVGLVAGWLATRSALRAPILPALRGD